MISKRKEKCAPKKTTKNLNNISHSHPNISKTNCHSANCIIYCGSSPRTKTTACKRVRSIELISQAHSRNVCSRLDLIKMQVNSFGHNLVAFEIVLAWLVSNFLILCVDKRQIIETSSPKRQIKCVSKAYFWKILVIFENKTFKTG